MGHFNVCKRNNSRCDAARKCAPKFGALWPRWVGHGPSGRPSGSAPDCALKVPTGLVGGSAHPMDYQPTHLGLILERLSIVQSVLYVLLMQQVG